MAQFLINPFEYSEFFAKVHKYWKGFLMRRPKTIKIFLRSFYNSSKKELFKLCSMQLYVSLSPDYTLISFDDRYLLHKDLVWHYYMAI